ncbi:hypothetical protein GLOIN_2v1875007 [Rhizophagus irregularis DAOM 181602=DAOM 197198]|uniref:Uncharacterized protein n=1 Tax=Rhizophagus irregularis (strain DAOM 181602 / DAOM 197198 / MUCL 43194) TaxID=747089 RepID=A0A2P4Q533_RHIID|nr:hypothetical protein GLOIN_2v1875007 [Rhizophagus irregularis DAOM 181602=DAOM 197198]POG72746.1 hypothetical protein GLOIN_2v1875007 [Rhizophagus irregularis DAOM 181602=DAOM 197198]|eukprot:XP_025179612.1 hypothetical protein GLOIN_2v1875007 [Rhizophagus irregularis DAOM 181602=DAOM 197198]
MAIKPSRKLREAMSIMKVITYNTLALLEQKISIITTDSWTSINSRRWMKQNKKNIHPIPNEENFEIAIDSSLPANIKDIDLAPLVRQLNAKAVNVPLSSTKDRLMSPLVLKNYLMLHKMIILKSKTLTTNNLDQFVRVTNNDNDLILQQQSLENTMHILTSTQIATKNINDLENSISQWKQKEEPNLK